VIKEAVLMYFAGLLQRLEEETHLNTYIVKQKLPTEISTRHKEVEILQHVLSEPAISRGYLDALNSKVTFHAIVNFLATSWSLEHFHVYIFYW
jgi:hypothetical protein